jgi:hypothetical protein
VLGAFFELAGEVDGGGNDEVGVRSADFDSCVEALDVYLGCCYGLLADLEALA